MMSVSDYASDVNLSVEKILKLCSQLEIKAETEEDMLDDDAIIMLDNEIANMNLEETSEIEQVEEIEEVKDEITYEEPHIETNNKSSKKKKNKPSENKKSNKKNDFHKEKKCINIKIN